jgi:hypothetical protein
MFEKILEVLERIATALERSAAYANAAPKTTVSGPSGQGKTPLKEAAKDELNKSPVSGKPSSASKPKEVAADDGLGDEAVTFEQMREKLVEVKQHPKLGPTKSSALLTKYGKLPDIKESDYAKLVAECKKLLVSVG